MTDPTRPVLRYLGGKWKLAPWLIRHFPPHRIYCEPYGGAASVLLRKERSYSEIYNDLDKALFELFQVLRDGRRARRLIQLLELTPFSREEYELSWEPAPNSIERARRLIVRSFVGHASMAPSKDRTSGMRGTTSLRNRSPERDWQNYPACLKLIVRRLMGVRLENRPALELIDSVDGEGTLLFCDPPYPHATRSTKKVRGELYSAYAYELTDEEHVTLLERLKVAKGMVAITSYPNPLYEEALAGWPSFRTQTMADGAHERTEVLWLNPAAARASRRQGSLFDEAQ